MPLNLKIFIKSFIQNVDRIVFKYLLFYMYDHMLAIIQNKFSNNYMFYFTQNKSNGTIASAFIY